MEVTFPWLEPYLSSVDVLERLAHLMHHEPLRAAVLPAFEAACELTRKLAAGVHNGLLLPPAVARAMREAGVEFELHPLRSDLGAKGQGS